jgi:hypothetical protein
LGLLSYEQDVYGEEEMASENLIPPWFLYHASERARDRLLRIVYGLEQEELEAVRSIQNVRERTYEACRTLCDAAGSAQATALNLVAVAEREWRSPNLLERNLRRRLDSWYEADRRSATEAFGMPVPSIYLLLKETDRYEGNLVEAQEVWGDLQPSRDDWRRSITIPLSLRNEHVRTLVGILKGDAVARIAEGANQERNQPYLYIFGRRGDERFYMMAIKQLLKRTFNLEIDVKTAANLTEAKEHDFLADGVYQSIHPTIRINSKVIPSWLVAHAGMPAAGPRSFASFGATKKERLEELVGALSTGGSLGIDRQRGTAYYSLPDESLTYLMHISHLAHSVGYSPRLIKHVGPQCEAHQLRFSAEETRRFIEEGLFINPRILGSLFGWSKGGAKKKTSRCRRSA